MSDHEDRISRILHDALDGHVAADAKEPIKQRAAAVRRFKLIRNTALPAAALAAAAAISVAFLAGNARPIQHVVITAHQPQPTATTPPSAPTTATSPASTPADSTPTTAPAPTTTSPFQVSAWLPSGDYLDGPIGTPHYVMTVIDMPYGFAGKLYFLYQDGRTSAPFTFTAQVSPAGTFTLTTNSGATHPGTYSHNTLTLTRCGSYLTRASTTNPGNSPPQSCTFNLSTPPSTPTSPPACTTGQLSTTAYQGSGGGGQEAVVVVFHNRSTATCELTGYPTAWFVNSSGTRISAVSTDQAAPTPQPVTLAPSGQAATTVTTQNPSVPSSSYCQPASAAGIDITPPGQTNNLYAPTTITICTAHSNVTTTPVTAGSSQNGI